MNERFVAFKDKYPLSFRIPPGLHTMVKSYCADTEQTIQSFVERLLVEFFEESRKHTTKHTSVSTKKRLAR